MVGWFFDMSRMCEFVKLKVGFCRLFGLSIFWMFEMFCLECCFVGLNINSLFLLVVMMVFDEFYICEMESWEV